MVGWAIFKKSGIVIDGARDPVKGLSSGSKG